MPGKKEEEQVIIDDSLDPKEKEEKIEDGITIPLDENGDPIPADEAKKQEEEAEKSKEEEQRKRNAEFAQRRIDQDKQRLRQELDESRRRIAELEKKESVPNVNQEQRFVIKDKAYWEKRLADNPVDALDEHYEFKREQQKRKDAETQERERLVDSYSTTFQESTQMATEAFPSLENEESPEYALFMDVLGKNPEWRNSPIGPMKVVHEMRKIMANGTGGKDVISKVKAEAETNERNRQARIVNQPLSSTRTTPHKNAVVLTTAQMQMWKDNFKDRGITLEAYAAQIKRSQKGGGTTL